MPNLYWPFLVCLNSPGVIYQAFSQKEAKELDVQVQYIAGSLGAAEVMTKMARSPALL